MAAAIDRADALIANTGLEVEGDPVATLKAYFSQTPKALSTHAAGTYPQASWRYHLIGAGWVGYVFEAGPDRVIKLSIDEFSPNMWNDMVKGTLVHERFDTLADSLQVALPRTPAYYAYLNSGALQYPGSPHYDDWRLDEARWLPGEYPQNHHDALIEERILPLPTAVRESLIDHFCAHSLKSSSKALRRNKDCLARLYLGRKKHENLLSKAPPTFSLLNFPFHLNQVLEVCAIEDITHFCKLMARALAVMHFCCEVDANDVEFVLGSAPVKPVINSPTYDFLRGLRPGTHIMEDYQTPEARVESIGSTGTPFRHCPVQLWILDFDKVNSITLDEKGMEQAWTAAEENDPYFPKPCSREEGAGIEFELWNTFSHEYRSISERVLESRELGDLMHLPQEFLNGWAKLRAAKSHAR